MQCIVCGCPESSCQQGSITSSFFDAFLDMNYLASMVVPCFARRQLHNMTSKLFIALDSEGDEYVFCLKKQYNRTLICGAGYEKFISNYDLKSGDRVRVELDTPAPHFRIRAIEVVAPPEQSGSDVAEEGDVSEHGVEADSVLHGAVVVYSNGLEFNAAQRINMNTRVLARGRGLGAVLVHKLTPTDTEHNGLRIPKRIVSALKIPKRGWVILAMGDHNIHKDVEYFTLGDGRIRFKSGWVEFCKEFQIPDGLVVLVMFQRDPSGYVLISFDKI